jgi:hypothetical protein
MNLRRNKHVLKFLHKHPSVYKKVSRVWDKTPDVEEYVKKQRGQDTPKVGSSTGRLAQSQWYDERYLSVSNQVANLVNSLRKKTKVTETVHSQSYPEGITLPEGRTLPSRPWPPQPK